MERITKADVELRVDNVNRRIESSGRHLELQLRSGYWALDEYEAETCLRTITVGRRRQVAEFIHAMMVGIDLSRVQPTPEALGIDTSKDGWLVEYERRTGKEA
jgi:hypothetical protein